MLNSSRDEATRRRELALARFAPLRELTPARGIRLERSPEGNAPSPTAGSRCRECSRPAAHGRFWTLMRKRSQLRSVASTLRYHLPRCGRQYPCTDSCRAHINSNDRYLRSAVQLPESQSVEVSGRVRCRPSSRRWHGAHRVAAADLCGSAPPDRTPRRSGVVFAINERALSRLFR